MRAQARRCSRAGESSRRLWRARCRRHLGAAERRSCGHPRCVRSVHRRRQRVRARGPMAVRLDGEGELHGHIRLDTGRRRRDGLRPGPPEQRPRARARHREAPVGPPLPRAQRRAERARGGRRAGLRRDRLGCVRALRRHGPPAVEPASHQRNGAVRRHRARRLGRARLHQYRRLPAGRAGRDLRAGRRDRCRALEVRHDPGAVAASARGRRGWALVPGVRRRRGPALRGELEPAALGRIPRAPERRRLPRRGALHELAARASTRAAADCSGTTR